MKTTEKKRLMEWMGWVLSSSGPAYHTKDGPWERLESYDPTTNPTQFLEVWNELGGTLRYRLGARLRHNHDDFAKLLDGPEIEMTTWILNHPPEVIEAVLQIIPKES